MSKDLFKINSGNFMYSTLSAASTFSSLSNDFNKHGVHKTLIYSKKNLKKLYQILLNVSK